MIISLPAENPGNRSIRSACAAYTAGEVSSSQHSAGPKVARGPEFDTYSFLKLGRALEVAARLVTQGAENHWGSSFVES